MFRVAVFLVIPALTCAGGELFRDDFSRFPPGWLSRPVGQLNGAIQEYHHLDHRGISPGPWHNPIVYQDAWVAGDEDGKPYIEQHLINDLPRLMSPLLVTGDAGWRGTTTSVRMKPLSTAEMAGLVFRYQTNRHYFVWVLTGGNKARLALRLPLETEFRVADWKELGSADFAYDTKSYYELRVSNDGPRISAYVNGKLLVEAVDKTSLAGRAGLTANIPARFQDFVVTAPNAVERSVRQSIAKREAALVDLRAGNPQPKLWKKFDTPKFGAGRNVRFGDLDGDGAVDMLIAQNVPKVRGDAFDHISCLTAITLDGKVLWQIGRPDSRNGLLTNDTPFQIHDLDGDGKNEVVLVKDFKLQVLEGATGKVRQTTWMPEAPRDNKERPYELNNGDSIAFVNLSGKNSRREIVIKDRYRSFWVFDNDLKLLWKGEGQTGHYPFPFDLNKDGRDEFQIGWSLWSSPGRRLWSRDTEFKDHTDAISIGNYSGDAAAEPRIYACGSDEGFVVFAPDGRIVRHVRIGHAQTQSVGKYRPEMPGLQIMTVNFWKNPGIVTLFDHQGTILLQQEMVNGSSHVAPVNWRGDGQEFALLSGSARSGGMVDGLLQRVVVFPDDGHPDLAYHVADLTGDARDEVILWDQEKVWIYTQDRPFAGERIYSPVRNPGYNDSNYRATVSLPAWKPLSSR